jgi:hypothetical protein
VWDATGVTGGFAIGLDCAAKDPSTPLRANTASAHARKAVRRILTDWEYRTAAGRRFFLTY